MTGRENAARVICALLEADHPEYVFTINVGPRQLPDAHGLGPVVLAEVQAGAVVDDANSVADGNDVAAA